jgi:aldose sugar dehydrogenase
MGKKSTMGGRTFLVRAGLLQSRSRSEAESSRGLKPALLAMAVAVVGWSQQNVPFQNGIPVAPQGLAGRKLPKLPMDFDTGEGQRIRVTAVTQALEYPWALAFLPDGSMLITERPGRLRIVRNGVLDPKPVGGAPASYWSGDSGLPGAVHGFMDVALHPRFSDNHWIYLT